MIVYWIAAIPLMTQRFSLISSIRTGIRAVFDDMTQLNSVIKSVVRYFIDVPFIKDDLKKCELKTAPAAPRP